MVGLRLIGLRNCIFEDECWPLTAQLHQDRFEVLCADLTDLASECSAADEINLPHGFVRNDGLSGFCSILTLRLDDVDDPSWYACCFETMYEQMVCHRAQLRSLQYNRATRCEHLADSPQGQHDRAIPSGHVSFTPNP